MFRYVGEFTVLFRQIVLKGGDELPDNLDFVLEGWLGIGDLLDCEETPLLEEGVLVLCTLLVRH